MLLFTTMSVLLLAAAVCNTPGALSYSLPSSHRHWSIIIPTTMQGGRRGVDDRTLSRLQMALGNNYLESFGRRREENNDNNNDSSDDNSNTEGGGFANGWNGGGRGGGTRTAIRPPSLTSRNSNINHGGGIVPLVVSINQPQDLLDFVIRDERLSVGEYCMPPSDSYCSQSIVVILFLIVCVISPPPSKQ
jgi:hypothetical protein